MPQHRRGFTLIEMMIAVVIVAILAAFAIPSYQQYVIRSNRTEGLALLNDGAARQERFFAQNNRYVTAQDDVADLGMPNTTGTTVQSTTGLYSLGVSVVASDGGFTLTATPQGRQTVDTDCVNLTLKATGVKGASGASSSAEIDQCWR